MDLNTELTAMIYGQEQGVSLEDRIGRIERILFLMHAPEHCGQPSEFNKATGQFVCGACLSAVGHI